MGLKPYSELIKIDVLPFCDTRDGKDDKGQKIKIPYLNWAKCVDLLHENGAQDVYFEPVENTDGTFLFSSAQTQNKDGKQCGNYFVKVNIHIDDLSFTQSHPLMNGAFVVYTEMLNQLRISNAHARAFVKGVAIRTGLGLKLWMSEDTPETVDDASMHSPMKVKQYIEELLTAKIRRGMQYEDILADINFNKKQLDIVLRALDNAAYLIGALSK